MSPLGHRTFWIIAEKKFLLEVFDSNLSVNSGALMSIFTFPGVCRVQFLWRDLHGTTCLDQTFS